MIWVGFYFILLVVLIVVLEVFLKRKSNDDVKNYYYRVTQYGTSHVGTFTNREVKVNNGAIILAFLITLGTAWAGINPAPFVVFIYSSLYNLFLVIRQACC